MPQHNIIPIHQIYTLPEFNPRRHFDEAGIISMAESINRIGGLIHPIVVRRAPTADGEFHLIAGERRFRGTQAAGREEIEAIIHECSLDDARKIAIEENSEREDVSAGEEAVAAQKVLDAVGGDRAVAAKELGWSVSKLDSRLLLLHAVPDVLDALARGDILIGHAEQLAGVPDVTQRGTLAKVIEDKVTVKALKDRLKTFSLPLSSACFDTADCVGCPHNTETQASLFGDPIEGSNCLNRECFNDKTQVALASKKADLGDKFNVVVLTTEKPDDQVCALVKSGSTGVGPKQFRDCQQCAHFGARIENRLNGQTGKVTDSLCFNVPCNTEMVSAYRATSAKAGDPATNPDAGKAASPGKAGSKTKKPGTSKPSAELTKKAKAVISAQVRSAAREVTRSSPGISKALAVESMLKRVNVHSERLLKGLPKDVAEAIDSKALSMSSRNHLQALVSLSEPVLDALIVELGGLMAEADRMDADYDNEGFQKAQLGRAMCLLKPRLDPAEARGELPELYQVNVDFLEALPKAAIAALLDEIGFAAWYTAQHDEAAYKSLLAQKKPGIPKAIMTAGFDWAGKRPKLIEAFLNKL